MTYQFRMLHFLPDVTYVNGNFVQQCSIELKINTSLEVPELNFDSKIVRNKYFSGPTVKITSMR